MLKLLTYSHATHAVTSLQRDQSGAANDSTLRKRCRTTADNESDSESESATHDDSRTNCAICLERVEVQGRIDSCAHQFCLECIRRWAEKENTCPLCKQRFYFVQRVDVSDSSAVALFVLPLVFVGDLYALLRVHVCLAWRGVAWRGVAWRGVASRRVASQRRAIFLLFFFVKTSSCSSLFRLRLAVEHTRRASG